MFNRSDTRESNYFTTFFEKNGLVLCRRYKQAVQIAYLCAFCGLSTKERLRLSQVRIVLHGYTTGDKQTAG